MSTAAPRDELEGICRTVAARAVAALRARGWAPDFDDALQGARYGAWRARQTYDPAQGASLSTWAWRWARRYADLEARKSAGLTTRGDGPRIMPQETPGAPWGYQDPCPGVVTQVAVRQAVSGLPGRERLVIWLRYWLQLDQVEIARELGVSRARVRALHDRAIAHLRAGGGLV